MCAQSNQSLRRTHEETLGPQLHLECTADAQAGLNLRWAHSSFCWVYHEAAHIPFSQGVRPRGNTRQPRNNGSRPVQICPILMMNSHNTRDGGTM